MGRLFSTVNSSLCAPQLLGINLLFKEHCSVAVSCNLEGDHGRIVFGGLVDEVVELQPEVQILATMKLDGNEGIGADLGLTNSPPMMKLPLPIRGTRRCAFVCQIREDAPSFFVVVDGDSMPRP